jgi:hypothetical protein
LSEGARSALKEQMAQLILAPAATAVPLPAKEAGEKFDKVRLSTAIIYVLQPSRHVLHNRERGAL